MYRFFVDEKIGNKFKLSKEVLNHLKIIRLKKDEKFYCNFENKYYICHLDNNFAVIEKETDINNEFDGEIVLFAAIINIKKFEWLVQKATELGVKKIFPMITKNTNKKYADQIKTKISRLKEISKNSCEQSFRNILVEINEPIEFKDAVKFKCNNKFIAHEKENSNDSINYLFETNVSFFVGPEGGFDETEIKLAKDNNIKVISLGKKILRAETASIFLLSRIKN